MDGPIMPYWMTVSKYDNDNKAAIVIIEIKPDDEKLIEEKLRSGAFDSVQDLIHRALVALPAPEPSRIGKPARPAGKKSLVELFAESPLKGLDLDFSRNRSTSRPIDLGE
jgi:hypothetical protein